jgi:hexosaminidase
MWSELIRTSSRMDWMLWPRLLALAERSWHKADWEQPKSMVQTSDGFTMFNDTALSADWAVFATTVGHKETRRLEVQGVEYYLPRPGAR